MRKLGIAVLALIVAVAIGVATATAASDSSSDASGPAVVLPAADMASASSAPTAVVTSGGGWPSTYFNGPLGNNEVLPATQGRTLLSLWTGGSGMTASQGRSLIQQRITDMGRTPDLLAFLCDSSCSPGSAGLDTSSTDLSENWIHSLGAVPLITWDPGTRDYAAVAAGNYDVNIDSFASRVKNFNHRVMVRIWEEFNDRGTWSPPDFVSAWRHIVNRFAADGVTNVGFVWCPEEEAGNRSAVDASYPGNTYVDWVSSDRYNTDSDSFATPLHSGWAEFGEIFNYSVSGAPSIEQEYGPTKPFFVSETSSRYDTAGVPTVHTVDPNRKADWFINIESAAANMQYLIGVQFFDADVHSDEPGNNWRVERRCDSDGNHCSDGSTDATTYSGFLSMADSSQFSGGIAGGTQ